MDRDLVDVYNRVTEEFSCDRHLRASTWAPITILPNPNLYSTVFEMCSGSRTERITHKEHEYLLRTARKIHKAVSDALDYVRWQQHLQTRHSTQATASGSVHLPPSIVPIDVDHTVVTQSSTAVVTGHSSVTIEADEDSHEAPSQLPGSWNSLGRCTVNDH
ncbi:hypothetical protein EJ07DRAFT_159482 [Lizonia empirigonia]|nr:hypothetical protein EJ07DRAFT_159482 [Lizonia empirigonia]